MTIRCEFMTANDHDVGCSVMPHAPRVGEYIWLQRRDAEGKDRLAIYKVVEVAYWCPDQSTELNIPCTSAAVYVEPN